MFPNNFKQITVIGSSVVNDSKVYEEAYIYGKFLGERGYVVITGGRSGIMEAISKGAYDSGGLTIGIIPSENKNMANPYCKIIIPTGIGFARNIITALSGDIVVVFGGGCGTLAELSYAWQFGKTILAAKWIEGVSKEYAGKIIDEKRKTPILYANNLEELKEKTLQLLEPI